MFIEYQQHLIQNSVEGGIRRQQYCKIFVMVITLDDVSCIHGLASS